MAYNNINFRGFHKVKITKDRFVLSGETQKIKEVPFVRYNFSDESWDWLEDGLTGKLTGEPGEFLFSLVEFFKHKAEQFNYSCHFVEVPLKRVSFLLMALRDKSYDWEKQFVFFLRAPLEETSSFEDVKHNLELLKKELPVEGLILEDKTYTLPLKSLQNLMKKAATVCELPDNRVRLCGSPFNYGSEMSCLTALFARELMALKKLPDDAPTPSAKHQTLTHCSCISYVNIESDLDEIPKGVNEKKEKKEKGIGEEKEAKPKKIKGIAKLF